MWAATPTPGRISSKAAGDFRFESFWSDSGIKEALALIHKAVAAIFFIAFKNREMR